MASPQRLRELLEASFGFLTSELGFELEYVREGRRESSATYCTRQARVQVFVDALPPGVDSAIGLFYRRHQRKLVDDYSLALVVGDRAAGDAQRLTVQDLPLEEALGLHGELLRLHAWDLLRGETDRVPRLQRLRAAQVREWNKRRFGTSTGETPRFASRPDLVALFSDVTNDGLRAPRAYQAHWDYAYPLPEIARFLAVDEAEVQTMLDDWDGIRPIDRYVGAR